MPEERRRAPRAQSEPDFFDRSDAVRRWLMIFFAGALIVCIFLLMSEIANMQGDTRVVNYAGILRGGTQQLVKQELAGNPDDPLVNRLDDIMENLETGSGSYGLVHLDCPVYLDALSAQDAAWANLKQDIYALRSSPGDQTASQTLYDDSEDYFTLANTTTGAAESYMDDKLASSEKLQTVIVVLSVIVLILIILRTIDAIRAAREKLELSGYAYLDGLTGLPNSRRCTEMLNRPGILQPGRSTCCFMFDLNNLKVTNDCMGHEAGNTLIRRFADVLKESASADMFIGRSGGDEFIGIVDDAVEPEISEFLTRLACNTEKANRDDSAVRLEYAYGYAYSTGSVDETLHEIMSKADEGMYAMKAKMKGRTRRQSER